jgi:hypothetical protein
MKYVFVLQEMSVYTTGPGIVYTVPGTLYTDPPPPLVITLPSTPVVSFTQSQLSLNDNATVTSWNTLSATTNPPTFRNFNNKYFSYVNFSSGTFLPTLNTSYTFNAVPNGGFTMVVLFNPNTKSTGGLQFAAASGSSAPLLEFFHQNGGTSSQTYPDPRFFFQNIRLQGGLVDLNRWSLMIINIEIPNTTTSNSRIYVNNTLINTQLNITALSPWNNPSWVWNNISINNGGSRAQNFKMHTLSFYDRSLSQAEMTTIYNSVSSIIGTNI